MCCYYYYYLSYNVEECEYVLLILWLVQIYFILIFEDRADCVLHKVISRRKKIQRSAEKETR